MWRSPTPRHIAPVPGDVGRARLPVPWRWPRRPSGAGTAAAVGLAPAPCGAAPPSGTRARSSARAGGTGSTAPARRGLHGYSTWRRQNKTSRQLLLHHAGRLLFVNWLYTRKSPASNVCNAGTVTLTAVKTWRQLGCRVDDISSGVDGDGGDNDNDDDGDGDDGDDDDSDDDGDDGDSANDGDDDDDDDDDNDDGGDDDGDDDDDDGDGDDDDDDDDGNDDDDDGDGDDDVHDIGKPIIPPTSPPVTHKTVGEYRTWSVLTCCRVCAACVASRLGWSSPRGWSRGFCTAWIPWPPSGRTCWDSWEGRAGREAHNSCSP